MRPTIIRTASGVLTLAALVTVAGCADRGATVEDAADYPSKDVTLIVPYQAGGASDLAARTLANQMEQHLGTNIIVENRTGGAGSVGLQHLAEAHADGYTIGYLPVETVMLGFQGYDIDPANYDLIGQMVSVPATIAVPADSPYQTLDDLLKAAEEAPGTITVSNSGAGSIWEATTTALGEATGTEFKPVPFDGGAPAASSASSLSSTRSRRPAWKACPPRSRKAWTSPWAAGAASARPPDSPKRSSRPWKRRSQPLPLLRNSPRSSRTPATSRSMFPRTSSPHSWKARRRTSRPS